MAAPVRPDSPESVEPKRWCRKPVSSSRPPATIPKFTSWKIAPLYALNVQSGDADDDQTDVADAGKSQHFAQIGLPQCDHRPINRPEQTECRHQPERVASRIWCQWQGKAQNAERAQLQPHQPTRLTRSAPPSTPSAARYGTETAALSPQSRKNSSRNTTVCIGAGSG
jgi:hypothetical protein